MSVGDKYHTRACEYVYTRLKTSTYSVLSKTAYMHPCNQYHFLLNRCEDVEAILSKTLLVFDQQR